MTVLLLLLLACPLPPEAATPPAEPQVTLHTLPRSDELSERLAAASPEGEVHTNRLVLEPSDYLQQHAHNPVDWFPWGEEAFALARALDRPILLSVGYATCHWCHVMERESFEDPEIAAYLNAHYIPIKVDREARPDVDAVYMAALHRMGRRGGWPMTVWLTPEGEPFYAATYLPARDGDRGATTGFLSTLERLADAWASDRERIDEVAADIVSALQSDLAGAPPGDLPPPEVIDEVLARLASRYDPVNGGQKGAPKFPSSFPLRALLLQHRRTGDPTPLSMVTHTLTQLANSGLNDPLAGGFHRYSVDAAWQVPHFEKMLYDNARLAALYVEAWQLTGDPAYREVAEATLAFMDRELSSPTGAFAAALDADSLDPTTGERHEGLFYTWTPPELRDALGPAAEPLLAELHVTEPGNLDGRSVLRAARPLPAATAPLRQRLLDARAQRPPPLRDEAVIVAWNGLAISAFARAGMSLQAPQHVARAVRAAEALLPALSPDALRRTLAGTERGVLEDHALMVAGLLDLFEASADPRWMALAKQLDAALEARFERPEGAWARTPSDGEALLAREVPDRDGAVPSGGSVHPYSLLRLAALTGDDRYRVRADAALRAQAQPLARGAQPVLLHALDARHGRMAEIVIVVPDGREAAAMRAVLATERPRHAVGLVVAEGKVPQVAEQAMLVQGKVARDGKATAYVCERGRCEAPVTDVGALRKLLRTWDVP